jgi:hypothetical protein
MVENFLILAGVVLAIATIRGTFIILRKKNAPQKKADERFWITDSGLEALEKRFDKEVSYVLMSKDNEVLQFIRGEGKSLEDLAQGFAYIPQIYQSMSETLQYLLEKKFIEIK